MYVQPFSLARVQADIDKLKIKAQGKVFSFIELCRIEHVDTTKKVVSAYFYDTKKLVVDVPYCYPFYNAGYGIITVPTEGSLGIAAWDTYNNPIILAFTAPSTHKDSSTTRNIPKLKEANLPDLLEGELLFQSEGGSFLKLNKLGGLTLSSSIFAYINLDNEGKYELDIESGQMNVNGVFREVYLENYDPILEITKGRHIYNPTQFPQCSVELCYRVSSIIEGEEKGFLGLGIDGNVYYSGKLINLADWSECND